MRAARGHAQVLQHCCAALSACVLSRDPALCELAAAAAPTLLCGPAGLTCTEREAGAAALQLVAHLFASHPSPPIGSLLTQRGHGQALCLSLLNAAGGGMPSYLHENV